MDEATLQRLVDRLDIQDTLTRYASDDRRGGLRRPSARCFADDATRTLRHGQRVLEGGDAIVAWMKDATADLDWQHHMVSVYGVDIDGDEATALIYLLSHQTVIGVPAPDPHDDQQVPQPPAPRRRRGGRSPSSTSRSAGTRSATSSRPRATRQ